MASATKATSVMQALQTEALKCPTQLMVLWVMYVQLVSSVFRELPLLLIVQLGRTGMVLALALLMTVRPAQVDMSALLLSSSMQLQCVLQGSSVLETQTQTVLLAITVHLGAWKLCVASLELIKMQLVRLPVSNALPGVTVIGVIQIAILLLLLALKSQLSSTVLLVSTVLLELISMVSILVLLANFLLVLVFKMRPAALPALLAAIAIKWG